MNVLFHLTTGIGIAAALTDTRNIHLEGTFKDKLIVTINGFIIGVTSHGVLDYVPHCYPVNSKVDVFLGLVILLLFTFLANKKYRLIVGLIFLGCIFPDLVDLSPAILNKHLGLGLPEFNKIFPWHWHNYSGSIYANRCDVSTLNHVLVLIVVAITCWYRRTDLKIIFNKKAKVPV